MSPHSSRRPVVLVTGGNSGIGEAIALRLAPVAGRVLVAGRNLERAEAVARAIEAKGGSAWPLALDVQSADSRAAALARARELLGGTSIAWLVNAAGIAISAPLVAPPGSGAPSAGGEASASDAASASGAPSPADLVERHLAVNFHGARHLIEALLPGMLEQRHGRIVNVASSAALRGYAYVSAYCASKHALLGYSRAAALELAKSGVTLNVLCPHYVDTPLLSASVARIVAKTGKSEAEARAFFAAQNPGGRLIAPSAVADAAFELIVSDRNGAVLEIDGSGTHVER